MQRYGSVIELKKDRAEEYLQLHRDVWPEVLRVLTECNIRNYSIFLRKLPDNKLYLFSYFEYVGDNFDADGNKIAASPDTQRWWDVCKPCHTQLPDTPDGEWWAPMEEVFHLA